MKWKISLIASIAIPITILTIRMLFGPYTFPLLNNMDKYMHLVFSTGISVSVLFIFKNKKWNQAITPILLAVVFSTDEYLQKWYSWRAFEYMDLMVNLAGVAIASILFYMLYTHPQRKVQKKPV